MKTHHWIGVVVILLLGYAAGIMWPGPGESLKAKVTGAGAATA